MTSRALRVAVLGGGCAGVAAACELSKTSELRQRLQVTLYEASWRLGGKGATGRNAAHGQRIEEHGLHLWLGFYSRAFRLMQECFSELASSPWRSPSDVFSPHYSATLAAAGAAQPWRLTLPARPGQPWDPPEAAAADGWRSGAELIRSGLPACRLTPHALDSSTSSTLPWLAQLRCLGLQAQLALALARGLSRDVLGRGPAGYAAIDHLDLCAWLERWGASRAEVHDAPPIRALYNLAFAYPDGISGHGRGQIAAGAAVHALLQLLFQYRGAPFWRMRAGMGDTVFAPLYRLLLQRGVRVEFCHEVKGLRALPGAAELSAIELDLLAPEGATQQPLDLVQGIPCWPAEPRWTRPESDEALPSRQYGSEPSKRRRLLAGEDFDAAILAIPSPCHAGIANDLLQRSSSYRQMLEQTHSVATVAGQLWLQQPLGALGWTDPSPIYTSGPSPLGAWADMSDVLSFERWPDKQAPRSVVYFCDACPDDLAMTARDPAGKAALLERAFLRWSQLLGAASTPASARAMLHGSLADQYVRINHHPSDRYILSLPGTLRHRLAPDESGFQRLYLAGDWTRTSINGGSVEAAIESGQTAARCLLQRWG